MLRAEYLSVALQAQADDPQPSFQLFLRVAQLAFAAGKQCEVAHIAHTVVDVAFSYHRVHQLQSDVRKSL